MNKKKGAVLRVEQIDGMGILTLHYPEKKNALTPGLLEDLYTTLDAFAKKDTVRCVVIRGSGDTVFSSGYDISAIPVGSKETRQKTPDILLNALDTIKKFPYPTIAMLNGSAFGAGFNLCACCDIRIAADHVKLRMTPARLGVAYHPEGIKQFIDAFGMARTKEIFYTAGIFQGSDLLQKGLVDYLIPGTDLEDVTFSYAKKITQNAPLSLKGIKKIITLFERSVGLSQSDLKQADQLIQQCFQSDDLKEGQAAFLAKRIPKFTGK